MAAAQGRAARAVSPAPHSPAPHVSQLRRMGRTLAFLSSSALMLSMAPAWSQTMPTGGRVVSGQAAIGTPSAGHMVINQSSRNAIINWQGFSVGNGQSVRFENGSGATLNRVTGFSRSQIDGALSASGSLYLVNPNGITVGPGGTVTTGGSFIASTHDVSDTVFNAGGDLTFRGTSAASVINYGTIGALGGDVALIARKVENAGTITAPNGTVGLAAGYEVLVRDGALSDGKFVVRVGGGDTEAKTTGVIKAAEVELRANGGNVYALAGNTQSLTKATGVTSQGGRIFLTAGDSGTVTAIQKVVARAAPAGGKAKGGEIRVSGGTANVSGTLDAAGTGAKGGTIIVTAREIELAGGAALDASGATGGLILVGGDYQGGAGKTRYLGESLANAQTTKVAQGATIRADGAAGAGGKVVVWSDKATSFAGIISARGAGSASGGDAEVSGKAFLDYRGTADLRSERGRFGNLLLDPYDLYIQANPSFGMNGFNANADDSVLNVGVLTAALATANVTVTTGSSGTQVGDITVAAPIAWSSGSTLTLSAARDINVRAAITGGTGASVVLRSDNDGDGSGRVNFNAGTRVTATGGLSVYYSPVNYNPDTALANLAGAGTPLTAYMLVNTLAQLQGISQNLSGTYALGRDIDASATAGWNAGQGFIPIGNVTTNFTGIFDGDGHTISGLIINRPSESNMGLFGVTGGATLRNVSLIGGSVAGAAYVGSLVGRALGTTNISNASATGSVVGAGASVGGLVGSLAIDGVLTGSYATGAVENNFAAAGNTGGLVGQNFGSITNSYATGAVSSRAANTGGLVGANIGSIRNAYATGSVTSTNAAVSIGGLVGTATSISTITNAYATGLVSHTHGGGLVGARETGATVTNGYWDITTTGKATSAAGAAFNHADAFQSGTYGNFTFGAGGDWFMVEGSTRPFLRSEYSTTIRNAHQLQLMVMDLGASYTLANDIDLSAVTQAAQMWNTPAGFSPVGAVLSPFVGRFDGNGHTISNLTINRATTDNVGLFGVAQGATIRNVTLTDGSVSGQYNVGGLLGQGVSTTIADVTSSVNVTGLVTVGGLVGSAETGSAISGAQASGAVSGYQYIGGLLGFLDATSNLDASSASGPTSTTGDNMQGTVGGLVGSNSGSITNSHATGAVTSGGDTVGGLVGRNDSGTGSIANSYATGTVTAEGMDISGSIYGGNYVGGLVGTSGGDISRSYATGTVAGRIRVGGLVGDVDGGSITESYANASVTGLEYLGGLVGYFRGAGITRSYALGSVRGTQYLGGLVGEGNTGQIADSYAMGAVIGTNSLGGLAGRLSGTSVARAYATGWVSGTGTSRGGLVGHRSASASTIAESYWNKETTGQSTGVGTGAMNVGVGIGLTTAQMQGIAPYTTGFDPTVWGTGANLFPYFKWQYATTPVAVSGIVSGTGANGLGVTAITNGGLFGTAVTGANGYYYILAASGPGADGVLAYLDGRSIAVGAAFSDVAGINGVQNLDIVNNVASLITGQTLLSATEAHYVATRGGYADSKLDFLNASFAPLTDASYAVRLNAAGNMTLDTDLGSGGGLTLKSGGTLGLSGDRLVSAGGGMIISTPLAWSDASVLTLANTGSAIVRINAVTAASGTLKIQTGGNVTSAFAIDVDSFVMEGGNWVQSGTLPAFSAKDFRIEAGATFRRVTGGDGTSATPYLISDIYGLQGMASQSLSASHFALTQTIDANGTGDWNSGAGFDPIGTAANLFTGSLDGRGFMVDGLYVNRAGDAGLFGHVGQAGAISNLTVQGAAFGQYAGLLVAQNAGSLNNVLALGGASTTVANGVVGGLVGLNTGSLNNAGAAVGVVANDDAIAGGLVGLNTVAMDGGGVALHRGQVINSFAIGAVYVGDRGSAGGLIGLNKADVAASYAQGVVQGGEGSMVGGLVGEMLRESLTIAGSTVRASFATGSVTSTSAIGSYAGGLVGFNSGGGLLEDVYASGAVSGARANGGLVGRNTGTITRAYATGTVRGTENAGGLVGLNQSTATVTASFWNTQSTGQASGVGTGSNAGMTGLASAGMTSLSVFAAAGWDIDDAGGTGKIWRIYDGQTGPLLRGFMTGLTVTGGTGTKTYDGSTTSSNVGTLTYSDSGYDPDMLEGSALYTAGSANVGGYSGASLTLSGLYSTQFGYDLTLAAGSLAITQRALVITANAASRIYGNANPLTGGATGNNLVAGDSITSVTLTSPATGTSGVGTYDLTGSDAVGVGLSNYAITYATRTGGLSVTPRALTVTADAVSRIYGNANPMLSYVYGGMGLVNGDSLTGELATSATTASGVGTYGITQGTLAASANYDLTYVGADLSVTPRAITVTANAASRFYGNANPAFTYVVGGPGLANGDSLTGALTSGATTASGVGTYGITQGTLAASANYDLSYVGADLSVTPRALVITANAASRIYGNANPAFTYVIGGLGLVNGDSLTGALASGAITISGVGRYGITQGTLAASANYDLSYVGADLSVTPRALLITADAASRIYGNANPAFTYTLGGLGLVNGDSLTGALASGATTTSGVGRYGITQGTLAASANYDVTYVGADLSVTPRALTVTANGASRIYGNANPAFTYTAGGLVNGDSLTGALATGATTASGIGRYAITQGTLGNANYAISYAGADLSITPRALVITADTAGRVYGNANPVFTYTLGGLGLVNGDSLTGALGTGATTASGIGLYAITQGTLAASANYAVSYVGADLAITPRALIIIAADMQRLEGAANPIFRYRIGGLGLVNGDTLSGGLETSATDTSPPGTYDILQGSLAASANYALTYLPGILTIVPEQAAEGERPTFVETTPVNQTLEAQRQRVLMEMADDDEQENDVQLTCPPGQGGGCVYLPVPENRMTSPWLSFRSP
ncbi:MBG domain-containing protein [Xanthobacteraceae bacterium A53D]